MVSMLVSVFVGCLLPILIIGINSNLSKEETRTCYSLLGILGTVYLIVWGRDTGGINWFLLVVIAILILLNIKSPELIKSSLGTILNIFPLYLNELRKMELSSSDSTGLTFKNLLSTLIKIDLVVTVMGITPFYQSKQAFCVIIGTVIYLFVMHYILSRNEQFEQALSSIRKGIRIKLHLMNADYEQAQVSPEEYEYEEEPIRTKKEASPSKLQKKMGNTGGLNPKPAPKQARNTYDDDLDNIIAEDILPTSEKSMDDIYGDIIYGEEDDDDELFSATKINARRPTAGRETLIDYTRNSRNTITETDNNDDIDFGIDLSKDYEDDEDNYIKPRGEKFISKPTNSNLKGNKTIKPIRPIDRGDV